jgi:MFS family permease
LALTTASSSIVPLLGLVVTNAAATAFEAPARQAMLPNLVPREEFARAVTVMATAQSLAFMSGPALAGVLIGHGGVRVAFGVASGLYVASIFFVRGLPGNAPNAGGLRSVSLSSLREGLSFVFQNRPVLGAMTLDLFAVIFGGASALLPVYANDILAVGPKGYGVLTSSLEVGAVLTSLLLLLLPPIRRVGRAIVLSVAVYGLATIAFGLSSIFPLSVACYALVGMADQVSVVSRSQVVQMSTPDALRGRVSSVNMIFIGASNQLSAAEAGFVAALTSPKVSVVSGGTLVLVVVAAVVALVPALYRWRPPPSGSADG